MAILSILGPVALGLFVGVFSGLLGVGGGTIMVPAFRLLLGMEPLTATATSLFTIIPTSISGFVTHIRNRTCVVKLGIAAGLGGACTSPFGVWLASISPTWLVMSVAAVVVAFSAYKMFKKASKLPSGAQKQAAKVDAAEAASATVATAAAAGATSATAVDAAEAAEPAAPSALAEEQAFGTKQLLQGALIGLLAGVIAGYIGVGGGFLMVPLFISILGVSMARASGTSLVAILILSIPGAITQATMGNIDLFTGIIVACGAIPGAVIGAQYAKKIPEKTLRIIFGCFLFFAAIMMVVKELGIM